MKCLIVEDDKISCVVLSKIMSRHGVCEAVGDGQAAVDQFSLAHEAGHPYDLILMDIMLPAVDGLKSVQKIREIELRMAIPLAKRSTVIMTTALDDPRTIMKALYEADANSYLVKPIRVQQLEDQLRMLQLIP